MLWIEYRPDGDVPKELFYNDCYTDEDKKGNTALKLWKQW